MMRIITKHYNIVIIGLTILLIFPFTSCIKKVPSTNKISNGTKPDTNFVKTWNFDEYIIPTKTRLMSQPSIISKNEIYFSNGKNVYLFNGSEVKVIYTERESVLENFATDGKYFIYSDPPKNPEQADLQLPGVFVGELKKDGIGVVLIKIRKIDIPLSNAVQSISFIKPGVVIITTMMEYVILRFKELADKHDDTEITLSHYALQDGFSYADLILGTSANQKDFVFSSTFGVYRLNTDEPEPKLKLLFSIPRLFPDEETLDNYPMIGEVSSLDSNSVAIKMKNGVAVYERETGSEGKIIFLDTLHLSNNEKISGTEIKTVSARNENEFWAVTNNNLLISIKKSGDDWSNYKSDVILTLPIQKQGVNIYFADNDHPFIVTGNFLLVLSPIDTTEHVKNNIIDSASYSYLLIPNQYWDPGNTYGIAISDIDNDNNEEAYLIDLLNNNKLYLDIPPNAFSNDITTERGLAGKQGESNAGYETTLDIGIVSGDIDEDGDEDFIVSYLDGNNCLFLNNGDGYFKNATEEFGLDVNMWRSESVVLGDVNNDGFLDLFSTSFIKSNKLFINENGEKFVDVTKKSGLETIGTSITACFGDVNGDGYLDLYVGNWVTENRMYLNKGDGTFKDISKKSGTNYSGIIKKTNSVMFADFDNDGDLDLFVGNRGTGNNLFVNDGSGIFTDYSYDFYTGEKLFTYGTTFSDVNNDGWIDIFINYIGGMKVYLNKGIDSSGSLSFEESTSNIIRNTDVLRKYNTAMVTFDKNNDGDIDFLIGQYRGRDVFLENILNNTKYVIPNFLTVKVSGSKSNRSGVGTKLRLYKDEKLIAFREISSGYGYASSSSKIQHFGIPGTKGVYQLQVEFPTSKVIKNYEIKPGTFLVVDEYSGISKSINLMTKNYSRVLFGKDVQWFILKLLIVTFILFLVVFVSHLRTFTTKYIYIQSPAKTILISILFYSVLSMIISFTQKVFLGNQLWVNGTYNFFIEEIIPVILILIFFGALNYYYQSGKQISLNSFVSLFPKLQQFEHGEGMAINLSRLNFYVQNLESVNQKSEADNVNKRFASVVQEFREVTYPELMDVSHKLRAIRDKGFFVKSIKHSANRILFYLNELKKYVNKITPQEKRKLNERKRKLFKKRVNESVDIIKEEVNESLQILSLQFACDINETAHMVVEKFKSLGMDNICIYYQPSVSDTKVVFKHAELHEVLSIMVQNSIQAFEGTNKKEKTISINIKTAGAKTITIIEDNGKGLNEKAFQKLFLPGFTTKKSGHGFGLHYVKLCIDKYGGKISCQSKEGIGTIFTIELANIYMDKNQKSSALLN